MNNPNALKTFDNKRIRTLWDETQEKWYFSVVDVIEALTESKNPTDYLKKMRKRDDQLGIFIGTNCPQVVMVTETGKKRITLAADTQQLLRIIQSVPSVKAEPFKIWMAKVASDRLDQIQDPELSIKQAMQDYKRLGYSDNWINQRIKSIEIRKELTDEWKKKGLQESIHFATLTDIIYQSWSDMTAREYKKFKGLKKENFYILMLKMILTDKDLKHNGHLNRVILCPFAVYSTLVRIMLVGKEVPSGKICLSSTAHNSSQPPVSTLVRSHLIRLGLEETYSNLQTPSPPITLASP